MARPRKPWKRRDVLIDAVRTWLRRASPGRASNWELLGQYDTWADARGGPEITLVSLSRILHSLGYKAWNSSGRRGFVIPSSSAPLEPPFGPVTEQVLAMASHFPRGWHTEKSITDTWAWWCGRLTSGGTYDEDLVAQAAGWVIDILADIGVEKGPDGLFLPGLRHSRSWHGPIR